MNLIKIKNPNKFYLDDYIQDFREEINNLLRNSLQGFEAFDLKEGKNAMWRPAVELSEDEGNYIAKVEIPGVNKDNIEVEVSENSINIKAETTEKHEEKNENIYRSEIRYGKFCRNIPLPSDIDNSQAKAEYKDGILTITAPKSMEEQKRIKKIKPD
jgi:HSP20 family protein